MCSYRGMQDCFRAHPEMYGSELEDDEEELEAEIRAQEAAKAEARAAESGDDNVTPKKEAQDVKAAVKEEVAEKTPAPATPETADAGEKVVPKTAFDATDAEAKVNESKA